MNEEKRKKTIVNSNLQHITANGSNFWVCGWNPKVRLDFCILDKTLWFLYHIPDYDCLKTILFTAAHTCTYPGIYHELFWKECSIDTTHTCRNKKQCQFLANFTKGKSTFHCLTLVWRKSENGLHSSVLNLSLIFRSCFLCKVRMAQAPLLDLPLVHTAALMLSHTCMSLQTFIPSWAALIDATYPPGPEPITTRSTSP